MYIQIFTDNVFHMNTMCTRALRGLDLKTLT